MDDKQKLAKSIQILNDVLNLVESGRKKEALDLIGEELGVKKTQRYVWLDKILENADVNNAPEPTDSKSLEFEEKYAFNSETDQYIFFLKKLGKNIVLERSLVKSLVSDYSSFDKHPQTLSYLARKYDIPKRVIQEVFRILDFTHDDIPVLNEELDEDPSKIVDDLLTSKKFAIHQEFQKKDWLDTQEKAKKWEQFIQGQLHPFKDLLHNWEPPKISSDDIVKSGGFKMVEEDETVLIGLSDLHFGLYAEKDDLFFSDQTWTIEETKRVVYNYAERIVEALQKRSKKGPKKAVICLMGDLIHTLTGKTDKGTQLEAHPIGEKQLEFAIDALYHFFFIMGNIFDEIEVKAVNGNHSYLGDYALAKALQMTFRNDPTFDFELSTSRFLAFTIDNNGFVMDHGATSHSKAKLPAQKGSRSNYGQSVFLADRRVRNCDHRYYLVGDQHHLEHQEFNNFELIMFGTPSNGDRYADASVLISRPRQSCMIFTKDGLTEALHFYFD